MSKDKKSTKQKRMLGFLPLLKMSFAKANMLIFILIFANIGGIMLAASQAQSPYRVDFVYFCAKNTDCSASINPLGITATTVKNYYNGKLGKTFTIGRIYKVVGNQNAAFYGNNSKNTVATWNNLSYELFMRGYLNGTTKTIVQLGFPSMSNCGIAETKGVLAVADPFANGYCLPNWHAVVAHELGHTLGFPHYNDGRLMDSTACRNTANQSVYNCAINPDHAAFMKISPWMNSVSTYK